MARILGIDFGTKRIGIAATDPLKLIVSPVTTVASETAIEFLKTYIRTEEVEAIVCGHPGQENGDVVAALESFVEKLKANFPTIPVLFQDEQFTSKSASRLILESGVSKKQRRNKSLVDKVSAVLILQDYLGHLNDLHSA